MVAPGTDSVLRTRSEQKYDRNAERWYDEKQPNELLTFWWGADLKQRLGKGEVPEAEQLTLLIPHTVEKIKSLSFRDANYLGWVVFLPVSSIRLIGTAAFDGSGLRTVKIPGSVETIGPLAFLQCRNLKVVEFEQPARLRELGSNAFRESGLTAIKIPGSVEIIYARCFANCYDLEQVTFENGSRVTAIRDWTFGRTDLSELELPPGVTQLADDCLAECPRLTSVKTGTGSQLTEVSPTALRNSANEEIIMQQLRAVVAANAEPTTDE
ncbi:MAG: leucine-rich repeat domain-containing protein [Holosporaceae bacterium]|nr:leucine-rich repeat domain-containing protein [Holosporaceae bacterium]